MLNYIYSIKKIDLFRVLLTFQIVMLVFTIKAENNLNKYQPLQSNGEIPKDFLLMYDEQFEQEMMEANQSSSRSERKKQKNFILGSTYIVNDMLKSGRVMFNDPVGNYVNRVADELLKNEQELRSKLRFYVVRSSSVNAFATNSGIIFINLGLIAQLETEAQLAFILAHEIIHYQHNHVLDRYIESENISEGRNQYRHSTIDERVLAQTNYSHNQELEADTEGFTSYYLPSSYNLNAFQGVFDVLRYSHLPFNEIPFDKSFFESENYILPSSYFLEQVNPINMDEDYDDSRSTHPNIKRRRLEIKKIADKHDNSNRKNFILPESEFKIARDKARFECIRLYMGTGDYVNAIYNSYVLLKDNPDNLYLQRSVAGSLYSISKYKNRRNLRRVVERHHNIEGQSQQLNYLFSTIDRLQLNTLALSYAWNLYQKYPEDKYLRSICQDLVRDLVNEHEILNPLEHFYVEPLTFFIEKQKNNQTEQIDDSELGKYDRIRQQGEDEALDPGNYYRYALVNTLNEEESELIEFFEYYSERYLPPQQRRVRERQNRMERIKNQRNYARTGRALGIDTLVVVDPYYIRLDQRAKDGIRYMRSAGNQQKVDQRISTNLDLIDGLSATILNPRNLNSYETETFNDIANLKFWFSERMFHDDFWVASSEYPHIEYLIEKYGTQYFSYPGVISVRIKKEDLFLKSMLYLFTVIYSPLILYEIFSPHYVTYYYNVMFNIRNGTVEYVQSYKNNKRDRADIINNLIYGTYKEISREK